MANGNIFERALEISTPAFDSLLGVVQAETQRIERNRALIEQIGQKERLLKTEQQVKEESRKRIAEFEIGLRKELEDFRTDEQKEIISSELEANKELAEFKAGLQGNESLFTLEDIRDFNENANSKNQKLMSSFSDVFNQVGVTSPNIQWEIDPTSLSTIYKQRITNWSEDNPERVLSENEYRNTLNTLSELSSWIQEGKRQRDSILRSEDLTNIKTDINLIPQDKIDETLTTIRNSTVSEKINFAQRIANGEIDWATPPKISGMEEEEEGRKLSADQRDVQEIYSRLSANSSIRVPDFIRENSRHGPIPEQINLFDVKYRDILRIDAAFQEAAREGSISQIRSIDNEIQIDDVATEQAYQRVQDYIRLMNKSSRLPNTPINPAFNKEQNEFGLQKIDLSQQDVSEIWIDKSGQSEILGDPNTKDIGDILLENILMEEEVERGLRGL